MPVTAKRDGGDDKMLGGKKVRMVRGGGICAHGDKPAMSRDTMSTMLCLSTPGADPRPRWSTPKGGSSRGSQGSRGSHGSHAHATKGDTSAKNRINRRVG
jgi:hypothetical protein